MKRFILCAAAVVVVFLAFGAVRADYPGYPSSYSGYPPGGYPPVPVPNTFQTNFGDNFNPPPAVNPWIRSAFGNTFAPNP
jgi:hypothetical protein